MGIKFKSSIQGFKTDIMIIFISFHVIILMNPNKKGENKKYI